MTFASHADLVLNRRVLVVDDDVVQRTIIQKSAMKLGLETIVASSYEQAAALLSADSFDLMTLDLSLGERDGVEMLRLIARLGLTSLPIVVISGCEERILNSTRRVAESLGLALTACLTKPLEFRSLREALGQRSGGRAEPIVAAPKPNIGREQIEEAIERANSSRSSSRRSTSGPARWSARKLSRAGPRKASAAFHRQFSSRSSSNSA